MGKTEINDDNERIKDLILWARRHRVSLSQLTVGDVSVIMTDLALGAETKPAQASEKSASDLYREYGGKAYDELEKQAAELETVILDDDEP